MKTIISDLHCDLIAFSITMLLVGPGNANASRYSVQRQARKLVTRRSTGKQRYLLNYSEFPCTLVSVH